MSSFGCGAAYSVGLFNRFTGSLICRFDDMFDATWQRRLDRTSEATLTIREDCCDCIPTAWAHEIGIYRAGQTAPVWQGPVTHVENKGKELEIEARDKSAYWYRRLTSADITYAGNPIDAADLFIELLLQAEDGSPSGLAYNPILPTGVLVERTIAISSKIGDSLNDLSDEAIDWTVVGLDVYIGGVTVVAGGPLVLVTSDHWDDEPTQVTEGGTQVTRVVVLAQGNIRGIFPPGPAVPDPNFGILEVLIPKSQIVTQAEADAFAETYYLRNTGPQIHVVTGGSILSKRFPYGFPDLIPGRLFNILSNDACTDQLLTVRLSEVSVRINNGHEDSVKIDLQPTGQEDLFQ